MKDIPKCFGKNSGQSAGMAGPSFWMKRSSKGKKPNYCHAVFLSISKNLSRATGQRASGPFFKKLFSCVHCKKKECTLCLDLRNCNGNITRNALTVLLKLSRTIRGVSLAKTLQSACATY